MPINSNILELAQTIRNPRHYEMLGYINLSKCNLTDEDIAYFLDVLDRYPRAAIQIITLDLSGNNITKLDLSGSRLYRLETLLLHRNPLQELNYSSLLHLNKISYEHRYFTPERLAQLATISAQLRAETISSYIARINDEDPFLDSIYLPERQYTEDEIVPILQALREHTEVARQINQLRVRGNLLTTLDISFLPNLAWLDASNNNLSVINLVGLENLHTVLLGNNQLKDFKAPNSANIDRLDLSDNLLERLDTSKLTEVTKLNVGYNALKELETKDLAKLQSLCAYNNSLETIDLRPCINTIIELYVQTNPLTMATIIATKMQALHRYHDANEEDQEAFELAPIAEGDDFFAGAAILEMPIPIMSIEIINHHLVRTLRNNATDLNNYLQAVKDLATFRVIWMSNDLSSVDDISKTVCKFLIVDQCLISVVKEKTLSWLRDVCDQPVYDDENLADLNLQQLSVLDTYETNDQLIADEQILSAAKDAIDLVDKASKKLAKSLFAFNDFLRKNKFHVDESFHLASTNKDNKNSLQIANEQGNTSIADRIIRLGFST